MNSRLLSFIARANRSSHASEIADEWSCTNGYAKAYRYCTNEAAAPSMPATFGLLDSIT